MGSIGLEWPFSFLWLFAGLGAFICCLIWHARSLLQASTKPEAWKLILLRFSYGALVFVLIARPFLERTETDPDAVRVVALVDLSGSMNQRDQTDGPRRIDGVVPYVDLDREGSWINQARSAFGSVDRMGFADAEVSPLRASSWTIPAQGLGTSLGDSLDQVLAESHEAPLGAVVLFSDGRNNLGSSLLEAGEKFRERAIPVNVIGVGSIIDRGNLSVAFTDVPVEASAKEELVLSAVVANGFNREMKIIARLFEDERELDSASLVLRANESKNLRFSPQIPEVAGFRTYRVSIDAPDGDSDPSDDADAQVIQVRPPASYSVLYLSHAVRPLYPFLKRALGNERFQLSSLIRLGEETFHAMGEKVSPDGYFKDPAIWMEFDAVVVDAACLSELNSTLVASLNDFVRKRGGGLLLFGEPDPARELLGGLMPAIETELVRSKQNLSLSVFSDPLFTERKRLDQWRPFLPAGLPAQLITRANTAARRVVGLKGNLDRSILVLQAYGAGKSAYWGSSHDWRRALAGEERSQEFSIFWQGVIEWLACGTVERVKVEQQTKPGLVGQDLSLRIETLGSNFEPSSDARVEANVTGPHGFAQTLQLYPFGGSLGNYQGKFVPSAPGSYRVRYSLRFPDGQKLEKSSYLKVGQHGEEAKDTSYDERELRMLANLTGGEFVKLEKLKDAWRPKISSSLPTRARRNDLAEAWPLFIALFLAAGAEWIWRRKRGFK